MTSKTIFLTVATLSFVILVSCSNTSKRDKLILGAIDKSLLNSTTAIEQSNSKIYSALREKSEGFRSYQRVKSWYANAIKIDSLSKNISRYIDGQRAEMSNESNLESTNLYEMNKRFRLFKEDLLRMVPEIKTQFDSTLNDSANFIEIPLETFHLKKEFY